MIRSAIRRWLGVDAPPAPAPAPRSSLAFTTGDGDGRDEWRRMASEAVRQGIAGRQFGEGLALVRKGLRTVEVGQDSKTTVGYALDNMGDGLKAAYTLASTGMPDVQALWYGSQGFVGYQMCAILAQQWLIQKACVVPARDAIRKGFKITSHDGADLPPEVLKKIERANKRMRLKRSLVEFVKMGRVFGIRVALFVVHSDDPEYYVKPFNADGITQGSYRGISQIDPYWVTPELTTADAMDPASIDFYEPTFWIVNGKRVHKSHLVIMRGPEVPDILKPAYLYGGVSVPQMIYERVYASERCANEAPQLMLTKRATVMKTDVAEASANPEAFAEAMNEWRARLDNFGVKVVGHDDEVSQHDTSLADLDANIMTQYQLVAAIANVPATKLLGTSPKGFNATGEFEEANYHEELESLQANDMQPLIERHLLCLMRSEIEPAVGERYALDIVWPPLDSLTAEEQANVNKTKADRDKVLFDAGAIDGLDIRKRLAKDQAGDYEGIDVTDMDPEGLIDEPAQSTAF